MQLKFAASTAFLALTLVAGGASAQDFSNLVRQDLQAIHDRIKANHPAMVTPGAGDTHRAWLDTGLQDALTHSRQVSSSTAYTYLLNYYANGFRDSNISITPTFEPQGTFVANNWPGIATGWQNGQYVVTYVQQGVRNVPPVGAVLKSCNLQPIDDFAKAKLDKFEGDLTTEAGRVQTAPYLLWNRNNSMTSGMPSVCEFQVGRRTREYTMNAQPTTAANLEAAYRASVFAAPANPLAIETVDGRPWVRVNTLADNAGWEAFFAQVESQVETLRGAQGLVIDLRGAEGKALDSTARGYGLANRIWTPEFTVSRQPEAGQITYRATPENRQWFVDTLGRMQADPRFVQESAPVIEQTAAIVAAFDAALASGQQTFVMPGRPSATDDGTPNPVKGQVVVLVDSGCSNGCLDVLDMLTRLPNVRLAGSATDVDSIFIEQTVGRLPSNYADLSYGHKAWTSRGRANNQGHVPAQGLVYTGSPSDETAVRAFVATLF
jgi:hypothetical protein